MDFTDTPDEAGVPRTRPARSSRANAEPKRGAVRDVAEPLSATRGTGARQGLPAQEGRGRVRRRSLAQGLGRPRAAADLPGDLRPGGSRAISCRAATSRSASACACRRCSPTAPRSRSAATRRPRCAATRCGASSSPSQAPARTSPGCARARCATATTWVINGQKIWTSGAHWADMAILVTRSDPKAAKHKGLTFFFLSHEDAGDRDPAHQADLRASHFNEVYLTDVRIPDSQRLGAVGQGWGVAITTLMNERLTSGRATRPRLRRAVRAGPRGASSRTGPPSRTPRCASGWPTSTSKPRACAGRASAP